MPHAHLGVFLPSLRPVFTAAQSPPDRTVLGHKALFHRVHALFSGKILRQIQLAAKNVVAREFQTSLAVAQFKYAEPPQPAGQGQPRQAFPQGLMYGLDLTDVLVIAGYPHQGVPVGGNAAAAATHENRAPMRVVVRVTHFVHLGIGQKLLHHLIDVVVAALVHPATPEGETFLGRRMCVQPQQTQHGRVGQHGTTPFVGVDHDHPQAGVGGIHGFLYPGMFFEQVLPG